MADYTRGAEELCGVCFCQLVASRLIQMEIGSSDVHALNPMLAADQIQFLPQVAIRDAVGQTLPDLRELGESPLVGPEWNTVEEILIVAVQENMTGLPERLKALNCRLELHSAHCRTRRSSHAL